MQAIARRYEDNGMGYQLTIDLAELANRAIRKAAEDHNVSPDYGTVLSIEFFDRVYKLTPEDIGEIDVQYSPNGYRAIYGFTADGHLSLYMD
jgi:hypothetical protein